MQRKLQAKFKSLDAYHRFRWYAALQKQNTRENVSKISVSLACYRQIGSKSTNHSHSGGQTLLSAPPPPGGEALVAKMT